MTTPTYCLPVFIGQHVQAMHVQGTGVDGVIVQMDDDYCCVKADDDGEVFTSKWGDVQLAAGDAGKPVQAVAVDAMNGCTNSTLALSADVQRNISLMREMLRVELAVKGAGVTDQDFADGIAPQLGNIESALQEALLAEIKAEPHQAKPLDLGALNNGDSNTGIRQPLGLPVARGYGIGNDNRKCVRGLGTTGPRPRSSVQRLRDDQASVDPGARLDGLSPSTGTYLGTRTRRSAGPYRGQVLRLHPAPRSLRGGRSDCQVKRVSVTPAKVTC